MTSLCSLSLRTKRPRCSLSTVMSAVVPRRIAPISSDSPSISAGRDVTIGTTCSSVRPSAIIGAHGLHEREARLSGERMVLVVGMFRRRAGRRRNVGVVAVNVGAERRRHDAGIERLARQAIREMASMSDVDTHIAIERCLDHGMDLALPVDEAAGMPRERMCQDIALAQQRDHALEDRIDVLAVVAAFRQAQSCPK